MSGFPIRAVPMAALLSLTLLAACGGGGGSDGTSGGGGGQSQSSSKVTLNGVIAKGLLANADVTVYGVTSAGAIDTSKVLATTSTDSSGNYTLPSFTGTKDQPYVIQVKARADGSTTHLDEVTGVAQNLPADFVLRALYTPTSTGDIQATVSITPFSEMAVSAAERASGGVTASNAAKASSVVSQLLGFDPTQVTPKAVSAADTEYEKQLAVLLTSVSQLVKNDALGCDTGTQGEQTKCVVEAMAKATSVDTLELKSTSGGTTQNVSAALSTALTTVLADANLSGPVTSTKLATVEKNLGCASTNSCAPTSTAVASDVSSAIAAAKTLFTNIKSDVLSLISAGDLSASATGAANVEARKIKAAMDGSSVPVEVVAKDLHAMIMGAELWRDFQDGRNTSATRNSGQLVDGYGNQYTVGCTVYKGTDTSPATGVKASSPSEAGAVGCSARFSASSYGSGSTGTTSSGGSYTTSSTYGNVVLRHGFTLTPSTGSSFSYEARARRTVNTQTCTTSFVNYAPTGTTCSASAVTDNTNPQGDVSFTGTFTPTLNSSNGDVTAFTLSGDLPGAFKSSAYSSTVTMANHHHTWNITGTTTDGVADGLTSTSTSKQASVSGSVVSYSDASTAQGTLKLNSGKLLVSNERDELVGADLDVVWSTSGAEFAGKLALSNPVLDKSGVSVAPSKFVLSGALRSINSGVTTDVITATATAQVSGYANYDDNQPMSTSNSFTTGLSVVGTLSAPNRPKLEFTVSTDYVSGTDQPSQFSFQYRSLAADGTVRSLVNGQATKLDVAGQQTILVTEPASNLTVGWTGAASSVSSLKVKLNNTTEIGTIDKANKMLTFVDGSSMSLDLGL